LIKFTLLRLFFIVVFTLPGTATNAETVKLFEIPIKTIDGTVFKLSDFKGRKPVYLKYWASWCQPCRKQMPHLQHTFEKYGDDIEVIAVNISMNDTADAIKQTIDEFNLSLPVVIDENSRLSQAFNLLATPYHILLDINGNVVHKGHDVSVELNNKIRLLSKQKAVNLPEVELEWSTASPLNLNLDKNSISLLFFSSTWCDWYLKDSRPDMSANCINAQKQTNKLHEQYPQFNWQGVLTRLWTGNKELKEYQKKYKIKYSMAIDETNSAFLTYKVKRFPALIAIKNGKEIFRLSDFSDPTLLNDGLKKLKNM